MYAFVGALLYKALKSYTSVFLFDVYDAKLAWSAVMKFCWVVYGLHYLRPLILCEIWTKCNSVHLQYVFEIWHSVVYIEAPFVFNIDFMHFVWKKFSQKKLLCWRRKYYRRHGEYTLQGMQWKIEGISIIPLILILHCSYR